MLLTIVLIASAVIVVSIIVLAIKKAFKESVPEDLYFDKPYITDPTIYPSATIASIKIAPTVKSKKIHAYRTQQSFGTSGFDWLYWYVLFTEMSDGSETLAYFSSKTPVEDFSSANFVTTETLPEEVATLTPEEIITENVSVEPITPAMALYSADDLAPVNDAQNDSDDSHKNYGHSSSYVYDDTHTHYEHSSDHGYSSHDSSSFSDSSSCDCGGSCD